MRLDKFLQVSRLIKRRAGAKEACLAGRVQLNGRVAKPGSEIKAGDVITLAGGRKITRVEVLIVPERSVSSAQARTLYRGLEEERLPSSKEEE
ncbi:MAG: RNA-binding S4 domain-containing protein [Bacillota bacterium]|jgi:ribosomal 50S subunit-recycling heat shock protein|nr:RNA-binding S4 domain-containing protein [Bacillota bacterium]